MRRSIGLLLGLLLAVQTASAADFVMNELPNFSNAKQWVPLETVPLGANIRGGGSYVWGIMKKYHLRENKSIVGFEEYAYGSSEPYFKTWGRESDRPFFALRESESGPWQTGPSGASWWEVRLDSDAAGKVRGVWILLFVKSHSKAFGRFLLDPAYQPPSMRPETST